MQLMGTARNGSPDSRFAGCNSDRITGGNMRGILIAAFVVIAWAIMSSFAESSSSGRIRATISIQKIQVLSDLDWDRVQVWLNQNPNIDVIESGSVGATLYIMYRPR